MKSSIAIFLLLISSVNADEITRIESIVKDIKDLRSSYAQAQNIIVDYKIEVKTLQEKNIQLHDDLELYADYNEKEKKNKLTLISLEKEIKRLNTLLKTKEKFKKPCKIERIPSLKTQIEVNENQFPSLIMKEKYKKKMEVKKVDEHLLAFKAKAFKLNKYAFVYDAIDGEVVESWEEKRSFTSNVQSENWIKITGYFIDKVWQPSQKELWLKKEDIVLKELEQK